MVKSEFIRRLSMNFKDGNPIMYEDLETWMDRVNLTEYQIDILYDEIKASYKYKTFPTLAEIINIWTRASGERDVDQGAHPIVVQRKYVQSWDVKKIISKCQEIRKNGPQNSSEIDFLHQWSDLTSEYGQLKDRGFKGKELKEKLEGIKLAIIDGNYAMSYDEKPVDIPDLSNKFKSKR